MTSPNNGMLGEPSLREFEDLAPEFDEAVEPLALSVDIASAVRYLAEVKGR